MNHFFIYNIKLILRAAFANLRSENVDGDIAVNGDVGRRMGSDVGGYQGRVGRG